MSTIWNTQENEPLVANVIWNEEEKPIIDETPIQTKFEVNLDNIQMESPTTWNPKEYMTPEEYTISDDNLTLFGQTVSEFNQENFDDLLKIPGKIREVATGLFGLALNSPKIAKNTAETVLYTIPEMLVQKYYNPEESIIPTKEEILSIPIEQSSVFNLAAKIGIMYNENFGILDLIKGDYDTAIRKTLKYADEDPLFFAADGLMLVGMLGGAINKLGKTSAISKYSKNLLTIPEGSKIAQAGEIISNLDNPLFYMKPVTKGLLKTTSYALDNLKQIDLNYNKAFIKKNYVGLPYDSQILKKAYKAITEPVTKVFSKIGEETKRVITKESQYFGRVADDKIRTYDYYSKILNDTIQSDYSNRISPIFDTFTDDVSLHNAMETFTKAINSVQDGKPGKSYYKFIGEETRAPILLGEGKKGKLNITAEQLNRLQELNEKFNNTIIDIEIGDKVIQRSFSIENLENITLRQKLISKGYLTVEDFSNIPIYKSFVDILNEIKESNGLTSKIYEITSDESKQLFKDLKEINPDLELLARYKTGYLEGLSAEDLQKIEMIKSKGEWEKLNQKDLFVDQNLKEVLYDQLTDLSKTLRRNVDNLGALSDIDYNALIQSPIEIRNNLFIKSVIDENLENAYKGKTRPIVVEEGALDNKAIEQTLDLNRENLNTLINLPYQEIKQITKYDLVQDIVNNNVTLRDGKTPVIYNISKTKVLENIGFRVEGNKYINKDNITYIKYEVQNPITGGDTKSFLINKEYYDNYFEPIYGTQDMSVGTAAVNTLVGSWKGNLLMGTSTMIVNLSDELLKTIVEVAYNPSKIKTLFDLKYIKIMKKDFLDSITPEWMKKLGFKTKDFEGDLQKFYEVNKSLKGEVVVEKINSLNKAEKLLQEAGKDSLFYKILYYVSKSNNYIFNTYGAMDALFKNFSNVSLINQYLDDISKKEGKVITIEDLKNEINTIYNSKSAKQWEELRKEVQKNTMFHFDLNDSLIGTKGLLLRNPSKSVAKQFAKDTSFIFSSFPLHNLNAISNRFFIAFTGKDLWGNTYSWPQRIVSNIGLTSALSGISYYLYNQGYNLSELSFMGVGGEYASQEEGMYQSGKYKSEYEMSRNALLKVLEESTNINITLLSNIYKEVQRDGALYTLGKYGSRTAPIVGMRLVDDAYRSYFDTSITPYDEVYSMTFPFDEKSMLMIDTGSDLFARFKTDQERENFWKEINKERNKIKKYLKGY